MLRGVAGIVGVTALLLAGGVRPARAMTDNVVIKAHVPFAFQIEGRRMPAGDYRLTPVGTNELSLIEIQNADGHGPSALFLTTPEGVRPGVEHAEMVFDRVDGQRFLRAIRLPGEAGEGLAVEPAEVRAARAESSNVSGTGSRG